MFASTSVPYARVRLYVRWYRQLLFCTILVVQNPVCSLPFIRFHGQYVVSATTRKEKAKFGDIFTQFPHQGLENDSREFWAPKIDCCAGS